MRRLTIICLLALAAVPIFGTAPAGAGDSNPRITRVGPMRVSLGSVLTIEGKRFNSKRLHNTVIFRGPSGRVAFVKPRRASETKLVLVVPAKLGLLLEESDDGDSATRLEVRVLAGRFSEYTSRRLSPVVTTGG